MHLRHSLLRNNTPRMSQNTIIYIESPCIRMCGLNEQNICMGCFRSIKEILAWGNANHSERTQTLENVAERRNHTPK